MAKFQNVKGTRDFYPEPMRLRNWIVNTWRRVSLRNGFEEYDAPIFEHLELFTIKSGEEIAEQLFSFTDRGGRDLAIRPEITPSLARMVNAKIRSLPRPIKWFSVPRLCRAENPQRGRLREFFQWNVDVIGADSILADAECIYTCVDFLREVGLSSEDVKIRIGSRPLVIAMLRDAGVGDRNIDKALLALDKRPKLSDEDFRKLCADVGLSTEATDGIVRLLDAGPDEALARMRESEALKPQSEQVEGLLETLQALGAGDWCVFDAHIVRGLAYYTGVVYEAIAEGERAVAGGGRYDNLLEVLGGPQVGATGFGMGDVVLGLLLEEKSKVPAEVLTPRLDYFVIDAKDASMDRVLEVVSTLRRGGRSAEFSYARRSMGKLFKEASKRNAAAAVIVNADGSLEVKDLASGEQRPTTPAELTG